MITNYEDRLLMTEFRRLLSVVPPESAQVISSGQLPNVSDLRSPSRELDDGHRAKKKRTKGKDDDMDSSLAVAPLELMDGMNDHLLLKTSLNLVIQIRL